jgi:predicted GNAT superfamily acetyltransferase
MRRYGRAMPIVDLRDLDPVDLHALNEANALQASSLSAEAFADLLAMSFYARGFGPAAALLIALDQDAPYDNPNFAFFRRLRPRFAYVDRVLVDAAARGRGLASRLYADLFSQARAAGHDFVGCEVYCDPPNPVSDAFHAKHDFAELGRARLATGKTVRYLGRFL